MTDSNKSQEKNVVSMTTPEPTAEVSEDSPARIFSTMRHDPEKIKDLFRNGLYPYKTRIRKSAYEQHKEELQVELLKVQNWVKETGQKIVVLFEGRDAAGKGGTIKRFMEHLNPRAARVVALEKPTEPNRPSGTSSATSSICRPREMVFFDRSWYNRAGVERVMGFCTSMRLPGIHAPGARVWNACWCAPVSVLFKYWFSVTQEEQRTPLQGARRTIR